MDEYYSDLAASKLCDAMNEITQAIQYAKKAEAPTRMISNLLRLRSGISNRISDIINADKKE